MGLCEAATHVVPLRADEVPAAGQHPQPIALVFVHGLDSWRGTWSTCAQVMARRGFSTLSVDLRGHGESPLGDPEDFSPKQLVADVRAAVERAGLLRDNGKIVLVGHSMGGRVGMRYAAEYPEDLAALIIEDMDCRPRPVEERTDDQKALERAFVREYPSWEAARAELLKFDYGERRVDGWRTEANPRVYDKDGAVWSAINPYARQLARCRVLASDDGLKALIQVAGHLAAGRGRFPVHVLVAGNGVCSWDALPGGVHDMASVVPGLRAVEFPRAWHSIHNSDTDSWADYLERVAVAAAGPA